MKPSQRIKEIIEEKLKFYNTTDAWPELHITAIIQFLDEQASKEETLLPNGEWVCYQHGKAGTQGSCLMCKEEKSESEYKNCRRCKGTGNIIHSDRPGQLGSILCPDCNGIGNKPKDKECQHEAECNKCKRHIRITEDGQVFTFPSTDMMNFMSGNPKDNGEGGLSQKDIVELDFIMCKFLEARDRLTIIVRMEKAGFRKIGGHNGM